MRLVIQRVSGASVSVGSETLSSFSGPGLLILVGVETGDTRADAEWLAAKTAALRIFPTPGSGSDVMNSSATDIGAQAIAVSQFTLTASTRKGNRPSYIRAAHGSEAEPLYDLFCSLLASHLGSPVGKGRFGADMQIALTNDGPVTIIIDSRLRE